MWQSHYKATNSLIELNIVKLRMATALSRGELIVMPRNEGHALRFARFCAAWPGRFLYNLISDQILGAEQ